MSDAPKFNIHHGGLSVSNLERSLAFYRDVLGYELDTKVSLPDGSMDIVHLTNGEDFIELFCPRNPDPLPEFAKEIGTDFRTLGTKHIAFVTDTPREMHAYLEEKKVDGLSPIYENNPNYYYFFFKDPDGIILEVVTPRKTETSSNETAEG